MYRELSGSVGIGRVHHYGTYGSSNVMVMDLLGASLEDLFTRCGRRFSLKTTLKLADQLLERVDAVRENCVCVWGGLCVREKKWGGRRSLFVCHFFRLGMFCRRV